MGTGTIACLTHAFRLLLRRTSLWWPGCLIDAALFVITLGWIKALIVGGRAGAGLVVAGWLLTAVLWAGWDAARWFAAERELRGDAGGWLVGLAGLRRRGAPWLAGTVGLAVAQAVVAVAGTVAFLHVICAGHWERLLAPVGMIPGWRERGWVWLTGGVAVLALLGALRTVLRWAGEWWRVALLVETPSPPVAMAAAIRFVARQRWAMTGRWLTRQVIGAVVWLTPWVTVGLLVDVSHRRGWELRAPLLLFWVCATAAGWALARTWLILADVVAWRRRGGADGAHGRLANPVRVPRARLPRRGPAPPALASEPSPELRWSSGRLASEPGELGLLFDEG